MSLPKLTAVQPPKASKARKAKQEGIDPTSLDYLINPQLKTIKSTSECPIVPGKSQPVTRTGDIADVSRALEEELDDLEDALKMLKLRLSGDVDHIPERELVEYRSRLLHIVDVIFITSQDSLSDRKCIPCDHRILETAINLVVKPTLDDLGKDTTTRNQFASDIHAWLKRLQKQIVRSYHADDLHTIVYEALRSFAQFCAAARKIQAPAGHQNWQTYEKHCVQTQARRLPHRGRFWTVCAAQERERCWKVSYLLLATCAEEPCPMAMAELSELAMVPPDGPVLSTEEQLAVIFHHQMQTIAMDAGRETQIAFLDEVQNLDGMTQWLSTDDRGVLIALSAVSLQFHSPQNGSCFQYWAFADEAFHHINCAPKSVAAQVARLSLSCTPPTKSAAATDSRLEFAQALLSALVKNAMPQSVHLDMVIVILESICEVVTSCSGLDHPWMKEWLHDYMCAWYWPSIVDFLNKLVAGLPKAKLTEKLGAPMSPFPDTISCGMQWMASKRCRCSSVHISPEFPDTVDGRMQKLVTIGRHIAMHGEYLFFEGSRFSERSEILIPIPSNL